MVTYLPFLLVITVMGASFPLLVYADTYDNAVLKVNEKYPDCTISNNTIL